MFERVNFSKEEINCIIEKYKWSSILFVYNYYIYKGERGDLFVGSMDWNEY